MHGCCGTARIFTSWQRCRTRTSTRKSWSTTAVRGSDDVFELFFKPAEDKPGYYEFQVNAAGTMLDMFLPQRGNGGYERYRSDDEFHMEAKVALQGTLNRRQDRDRDWVVEGRIPWRDFLRTGGRPEANERWKFALCRYDYRIDSPQPELSTSAPLTRPSFHRYEDYAVAAVRRPGRAPDRSRSESIGAFRSPPPG